MVQSIIKTFNAVCYRDNIYFPKRKFKFFNSLFHSVLLYLVFSTRLFSIVIERGQGFVVRFCGNYYFKLRYCGFTKQSSLQYLEIFG